MATFESVYIIAGYEKNNSFLEGSKIASHSTRVKMKRN